jgi:hypothetical protein
MVAGNGMTDAERDMIVDFGAFMYDFSKMAIILGWEKHQVQALMKDTESEFFRLYEKGKHMAEYVLEKKIFEMAQKGDIKAFEKIMLQRKLRT